MDKSKTRIVSYRDDTGKKRQSIIPIDADDSEAEMGLPVSFLFPESYEPVRDKLETALAARGIITPDDLFKPGVDELIRQAIQQVIRMDIQSIKAMNSKK